ncbi:MULTISPECIES: flavodoxin family protein [Sphingopyxis]|uniref:Multimeric flavodoxin WrbA n=1 Tax=Sphingopyxis granuli TaxID=267128 RepID=A0AA86L4L2_9SPHN|nr:MULTISPECIES: flavodoxin [Sphingopyxis]AMG76329.1 Multimeric flavodoxin WrbA [Sphingopyxis granuli]APW73894.1 flavodoxin [Sphingopyxis granuli]AVA15225.1 flavodoxin [Sphingopyxis sp. MG]ODU30020.1 MAG: flavodoxin [Sphingopyxis sp. SCN 67-31]
MSKCKLLVIWHSRTGGSRALAEAAAEGGGAAARLVPAGRAAPADLLAAQGYLFVGPENLAALSGTMKEMFDRCYYPCLGRLEGRPYATIICAGSDGENAQRQLDRIATGWRLRRVADPLIVNTDAQTPEAILAPKTIPEDRLAEARDLGAALAEGLAAGIF